MMNSQPSPGDEPKLPTQKPDAPCLTAAKHNSDLIERANKLNQKLASYAVDKECSKEFTRQELVHSHSKHNLIAHYPIGSPSDNAGLSTFADEDLDRYYKENTEAHFEKCSNYQIRSGKTSPSYRTQAEIENSSSETKGELEGVQAQIAHYSVLLEQAQQQTSGDTTTNEETKE